MQMRLFGFPLRVFTMTALQGALSGSYSLAMREADFMRRHHCRVRKAVYK